MEVYYLVIKVNKTHMTAKPNSAANVIHRAEIKCIKQVQFSKLLKDTYHWLLTDQVA